MSQQADFMAVTLDLSALAVTGTSHLLVVIALAGPLLQGLVKRVSHPVPMLWRSICKLDFFGALC